MRNNVTQETITLHKAHEILHAAYPQVTGKTLETLLRNRELHMCQRGTVVCVPLADVQRVLRSWGAQKEDAR